MARREKLFGMKDYTPKGNIDLLYSGTFYLTQVDNQFRRYYKIKGEEHNNVDHQRQFNWSGSLTSHKTAIVDNSVEA